MTTQSRHRVHLHWQCLKLRPNHWLFHLRGITREILHL